MSTCHHLSENRIQRLNSQSDITSHRITSQCKVQQAADPRTPKPCDVRLYFYNSRAHELPVGQQASLGGKTPLRRGFIAVNALCVNFWCSVLCGMGAWGRRDEAVVSNCHMSLIETSGHSTPLAPSPFSLLLPIVVILFFTGCMWCATRKANKHAPLG